MVSLSPHEERGSVAPDEEDHDARGFVWCGIFAVGLGLLCLLLVLLYFAMTAEALTLDATALSADGTEQVVVTGSHLEEFPSSTLALSGRYSQVSGRDRTYHVGMSNIYKMPWKVRFESDTWYYHSHTTFSAGAGVGGMGLTVTAGARVEFEDARETFGKLAATYRQERGATAITFYGEGLSDSDRNTRLDYRADVKYYHGYWYAVGRVERIRDVRTYSAGIGVKLK